MSDNDANANAPSTASKSEAHLGAIGGHTELIRATAFTRPADTTAYAQHDVVSTLAGAIIEFDGAARKNDGSGVVIGARCFVSANVATAPDLRLYVFDETPTAIADNATLALSDADAKKLIGVVVLDDVRVTHSTAGAGGSIVAEGTGALAFNTKGSTKNLYGLLVVNNAYVPTSAESFEVALRVGKD